MAEVAKSNLLEKEELSILDRLGWLYTVSGGRDYRVSLTTLLAALNKNDVGLSNVNNTADLDKPISNEARAALENINTLIQTTLATKEDIEGLIDQLQNYVEVAGYESKIAEIEARLTEISSLTREEINQLISDVVTPLSTQLQLILQQNYITQDIFNLRIEQVRSDLTQNIEESISTALSQSLEQINADIDSLTNSISILNSLVARIETLEANSIHEGEHEW